MINTEKRLPIPIPSDLISHFCQKNHIGRLSLFGSVLRDDFTSESDIDFLVEFEPGYTPGFFKLVEMEQELSRNIQGRKIDLRTYAELSPYFRDRVMQESLKIYDAN
jgi:predicted nucleotidyltransferase